MTYRKEVINCRSVSDLHNHCRYFPCHVAVILWWKCNAYICFVLNRQGNLLSEELPRGLGARALFSSLNSCPIQQEHNSEQHKRFLYTARHFPHDQIGICHLPWIFYLLASCLVALVYTFVCIHFSALRTRQLRALLQLNVSPVYHNLHGDWFFV